MPVSGGAGVKVTPIEIDALSSRTSVAAGIGVGVGVTVGADVAVDVRVALA